MYKICFIFITSINVFKKWDSNQIFSSEFLCSQRFSPYGGSSTEFHWITPLLKLFGRASLVLTVTILIEHKFTAWLFSNNGMQTKCGFCKEEWKIQLSVGKKLGKKNIRMSSLSYLSLNLLSSRHCWHDTRKQERLWQKNMFSIWHLKKKKKRKCVSFDYSNLRICSKSEFSQEGYKIRTLNMYDCGGKINYLNLFLVFLPLLAIPFFLLFVGNYQNFF